MMVDEAFVVNILVFKEPADIYKYFNHVNKAAKILRDIMVFFDW